MYRLGLGEATPAWAPDRDHMIAATLLTLRTRQSLLPSYHYHLPSSLPQLLLSLPATPVICSKSDKKRNKAKARQRRHHPNRPCGRSLSRARCRQHRCPSLPLLRQRLLPAPQQLKHVTQLAPMKRTPHHPHRLSCGVHTTGECIYAHILT